MEDGIVARLQALFLKDFSVGGKKGARRCVGRRLRATHDVVYGFNDWHRISITIPLTREKTYLRLSNHPWSDPECHSRAPSWRVAFVGATRSSPARSRQHGRCVWIVGEEPKTRCVDRELKAQYGDRGMRDQVLNITRHKKRRAMNGRGDRFHVHAPLLLDARRPTTRSRTADAKNVRASHHNADLIEHRIDTGVDVSKHTKYPISR